MNKRNQLGNKEGIWRDYYGSGILHAEGTYIGESGLYDNGNLWIKSNYIDGKRNGIYNEYYNNGQLSIECNYINGKRNGIYNEYYNNSQLWVDCNYIDGVLNGLWKEYNKLGFLISKKYYE